MSDIELFFEDPRQNHPIPRKCSILYLLRRDISVCFGIDIVSGETVNFKALWPGTMAILAGIDLLGKFYAGDDEFGKVGDRFKGFIDSFFNSVSTSDKDVIYQFRNSLLHSFGLYSRDRKGKEYNFTVDEVGGPIVKDLGGDKYEVDLTTLKRIFDSSVDLYKAKLLGDSSLQSKFRIIFQKYGYTHVW